jgi:glycosyltransferase involved in cell wall biosynthesis
MTMYSVVIPAYNCRNTLENTVNSVLQSGLDNFEIILIDDGSTDGTADLCDALKERSSCIRCIHKENAGVSSARNQGIREAVGEYILFVDADDELKPFDLEKISHCVADGADIIIFGATFRYYKSGKFIKEEQVSCGTSEVTGMQELQDKFKELFYSNCFSAIWNKFVRRSLLISHAITFDPRLTNYEDLAFSLYAISACRRIAALPDCFYIYHVDYVHDRTVDRIGKIDNVVENTDIIAKAFCELIQKQRFHATAEQKAKECLLTIYIELLRMKAETASLQSMKRNCHWFRADRYIEYCADVRKNLTAGNQKLFDWMCAEKALRVWSYGRYCKYRRSLATCIKPLLGRT